MNKEEVLNKLDSILANPKEVKPDDMEGFVHELLRLFQSFKGDLLSQDPETKEKAMESMADLKTSLEGRMQALCRSLGMNPSDLNRHLSDPSHFTSGEWASLSSAKQTIEQYKDEFVSDLAK